MLSFPLPVRTARAFIVNFPGSNLEFMIMASLFCFVYKYQCANSTHLGALKRNTAAFILLFGISHSRFYGLAAWAIFYVPDLFGVCHLLLVLWAYSYLCRFISTIPRVTQIDPSLCFGWFFLVCCFLFASRNVLLVHDFRSLAPAISPVDLGRIFLVIPDTLSVTGFLDRPGWWLPFSPFISFFQFRFRAITWGICALPSW